MEYNFREIEKKWQAFWKENNVYKVDADLSRPKYYVLDMFPYPSGAGLHVGHPLGYIASDIYARYKTLKGYNVLHPMGYDSFGLPAEQYAIQTGTHPAVTTEKNIERYREQLDRLGFSFDWSREVRTSDPKYYRWTQWAFVKMFQSYYCFDAGQARPIDELIDCFQQQGNRGLNVACGEKISFSAEEWNAKTEREQQDILMNYRLAYLGDSMVNWCPQLGTVLANDEVIDGLSERGGFPVERKKMKQWSLRITAYAQRLLDGLEKIVWPEPLKEIQANWIGRSEGASMFFEIKEKNQKIEIFTTRPDTIFGATFMVLAPEHEMVPEITTPEYENQVCEYVTWAKNRSEVERMAEKKVSGQFTGAYAVNPFTGKEIPIYIADYVLMGYGTGAIMAVPAHDSRDFAFARHFSLPIVQVVRQPNEAIIPVEAWNESYDSKEGVMINSGFIDGMAVKKAIAAVNDKVVELGIGEKKINYRLRDAIFSRQRYWGEPIPIYYKDGVPYALAEKELPLTLPEVDKYLPTETGEPPLARAQNWKTKEGYPLETSTMPGFAGSSAYYLRYMDPRNDAALCAPEAVNYWQNVDLYLGGREHATGHLIYSRFWNKFLFDLGLIPNDEPFKKLINQGMIQGRSNFVYRFAPNPIRQGAKKILFVSNSIRIACEYKKQDFLSKKCTLDGFISFVEQQIGDNYFTKNNYTFPNDPTDYRNVIATLPIFSELHVDVNIVSNDILDIEAFKKWRPEFADAEFVLEDDGQYHCGWAVEKMSKSKHNVVNPDDISEKYGADTLRLYEMFLGPLEQSKPWDTNGIEGVFRFLKKLWRLFHDENFELRISDEPASKEALKALHKTIKKIEDDIERFSFNTAVSAFMICVNELSDQKCDKREVLEPLTVLISAFAPHIAEELWRLLGHSTSVTKADFPKFNEAYLIEDSFEYPVSVNGKTRFKLSLPIDASVSDIEKTVLATEEAQKWIEGKPVRKVIVVQNKIINIVV